MEAVPGEPGVVQLSDGRKYEIGEGHLQPVFDEQALALGTIAADQKLTFFTNLINETTGVPKGLVSCNLKKPRQIDSGTLQRIDRVGTSVVDVYGNTLTLGADMRKLLASFACDFKINKIEIAQGPVTFYPGGYGPYGMTNESDASVITNGVPNPAAQIGLEESVWVTGEGYVLNMELIASNRGWDASAVRPVTVNRAYVRTELHGFQFAAATVGGSH